MLQVDPKSLDTAFVLSGTPMFSDLMSQLQDTSEISAGRRRDLLSSLRRTAKALQRAPETVPADPKWLQPRLSKVAPAALGLTSKSWSNVLSDLHSALTHAGITTRKHNQIGDLMPAWKELWRVVLVSGDRTLKPSLSRFIYFLNAQGIKPQDVCSSHAVAFRDALALNEISRSPETAYRNAVCGWNLATQRISDWPQQQLSSPSRQKVVKLPLKELPVSFGTDLAAYIASLENPDPFDPESRIVALRPSTIKVYKARLLRFAGILVKSGLPAEQIRTLTDLAEPGRMERGLRYMLEQNAG